VVILINGSDASLCPSCYSRGTCPGKGGSLISISSKLYLGAGGGGGAEPLIQLLVMGKWWKWRRNSFF
jgi:hypothetical protein